MVCADFNIICQNRATIFHYRSTIFQYRFAGAFAGGLKQASGGFFPIRRGSESDVSSPSLGVKTADFIGNPTVSNPIQFNPILSFWTPFWTPFPGRVFAADAANSKLFLSMSQSKHARVSTAKDFQWIENGQKLVLSCCAHPMARGASEAEDGSTSTLSPRTEPRRPPFVGSLFSKLPANVY